MKGTARDMVITDLASRGATQIGITSPANPQRGRNRILDFVRILLATLVLVSHAAELTDGSRVREPLTRYTHAGISFGELGVDFFFVLSGYLIVRSWQLDPRLNDFLKKRLLRIVPGYVVAFTLSVLICGFLAPGVPDFFHALVHPPVLKHFLLSFFMLSSPWTPPNFPGLAFPGVNNSLWTLNHEFRCYIFVALFGVLGLYKKSSAWLFIAILLAMAFPIRSWLGLHGWQHLKWLVGSVEDDIRLLFAFLVGGCFYLYRRHIQLKPIWAALAFVLLVASLVTHIQFELFLIVFGAYLLFFIGELHLPNTGWYARIPDISYGMYIYGWPAQKLCIWYLHPPIWVTFILSFLASVVFGIFSWHLVEKPMLTLKPRPSAPLPQG